MNGTRTPRVSVVVPVYNAEAFLGGTLDSLLAQTFRDYEAVIVDDGSTDTSLTIAKRYARRHPHCIRVLQQANGGVAVARNTAIAAARGELIAMLDADDQWLPNHLETALAAFDADPELGMSHSNIERVDRNGRSLGIAERHWPNDRHPFDVIALRHEHVACLTVVVRRRCIEAVGGFDPQFTRLGCEDRDLWLRIAERFPVRYLDVVTARYRTYPDSFSANCDRMDVARRLLAAKVARTPRGARLARHMDAMIDSDRGVEWLAEGRYFESLRAQLRALRRRPQTWLVWRRLARLGVTASAALLLALLASEDADV